MSAPMNPFYPPPRRPSVIEVTGLELHRPTCATRLHVCLSLSYLMRSRTRLTWTACHLEPRGVRIPRSTAEAYDTNAGPGCGREIALRSLLFRGSARRLAFNDEATHEATPHHTRAVALPLVPVCLQRTERSKNMARFYSLDVEPDLFGRVAVVHRRGRIGTAGRTRMDEHPDEGRAVAALVRLEASKRRRGYRLSR